jgi:hypothetical protein
LVTTGSPHKAIDDRKIWSDVTGEILRRLFTEAEFRENFDAAWDAAIIYGPGETLEEHVSVETEAIRSQLHVLQAIARKIDFMPEPSINASSATLQLPASTGPSIFISHSGKDADLAEALANLLRVALSLPANEIRCTSAIEYSLPYGVDATERLRVELSSARAMVGLVTPSSLESHWVLFEMGARWGQNKPLFCILAGSASHDLLPGPIRDKHSLKVSDTAGVIKFVEDLADTLGVTRPSSWQYERFTREFVAASMATTPFSKEADAPMDLERFKRKHPYEESVCWKI